MSIDPLDTIVTNVQTHLADPTLDASPPWASTDHNRRLIKALAKEFLKVQIETKAQIAADTNGDTNPPGSIS